MSPTLGSKSANGLIASQSTSINDRANARCAATDKSDHHLECHANSTARFKCGGSLRALYFANIPTRLMQVSLQRPPISHASVSSTILPAACAASRYVFVFRFSATSNAAPAVTAHFGCGSPFWSSGDTWVASQSNGGPNFMLYTANSTLRLSSTSTPILIFLSFSLGTNVPPASSNICIQIFSNTLARLCTLPVRMHEAR